MIKPYSVTNLTTLRIRLGITRKNLAEWSGTSEALVGRVLNDEETSVFNKRYLLLFSYLVDDYLREADIYGFTKEQVLVICQIAHRGEEVAARWQRHHNTFDSTDH